MEDQTWELGSILADFAAFEAVAARLDAQARALCGRADALGPPDQDPAWLTVIPELALLSDHVAEVAAWAGCTASANTASDQAARAEARAVSLASLADRCWSTPTALLARCDEAAFTTLAQRPELADHAPALHHARARRPVLLPIGEQQLFDDLVEDGLHAWGSRYRRTSGRLRVEVDGRSLSPSQARNLMERPDADLRRRTADALDRAWASAAEDCADQLSHIIGVREKVNARLGVDELAIPLVRQRIGRDTLDALLSACAAVRPLVHRYLAVRARLLGADRIDWQDLQAPLVLDERRLEWAEARAMVTEQLGAFSVEMGDFVRQALACRWVEAEDRPDKRPGAFCAAFPQSRQSRVFLTYGGGPNSVRTLAHELGHAYHNHVMGDLPWARRRLTSCLAETASTFAEAVVRDAMLAEATDPRARLALLDRELAEATVYLANIPARFEFERTLYDLRRQGPLDPEELSSTMDRLLRDWYGPALGRGFPLFWAEKLHFYLTYTPFYNFPYTFGNLFSNMVHRRAREEGPAWAAGYRALLRATGSGPGEQVAADFLGLDLRRAETWALATARLQPMLAELERLAGAGGASALE